MAVEEQQREEIDVRRRIGRLSAARLFFVPLALFGAVCLVVALAGGNGRAAMPFGLSTACAVILCAYWTASIRRLGRQNSVIIDGPPDPPKTQAEQLAEAVEAIRQRQWDAISGRAYQAAGGKRAVARPRPRETPAVARPDSGAVELDPRWEWRLVHGLGVPDRWVKVRCLHTEVVPVPSLTGQLVAQLCLTCDTQFPAPVER